MSAEPQTASTEPQTAPHTASCEPQPAAPRPVELRPKRPASPARIEASRCNVAKARRRWIDLRKAPGFEPSPRYYDATHSNLKQAIHRNLHDDSGAYAPCFRDGLSAISLPRSLKQAGESLSDYTSHMEWLVRSFAQDDEGQPLGSGLGSQSAAALAGGAPTGILKLSLALGFVSWRRLRGFRLLGEWERLTVGQDLTRLAQDRGPGGTWSVLTGHLTAQQQAAWAQSRQLVWMIDLANSSLGYGSTLGPKLRTLENRLEILARALLIEREEPGFYVRAQWGPVMQEYECWPAEVLGNPLRAAATVMKALQPTRVALAPVSAWRRPFGGGRQPEGRLEKLVREQMRPDDPQRIAHARKQEAQGQPASPGSWEEFRRLVEAALGREATAGAALDGADPDLQEFAEALWARLGVYGRQAAKEREELQALRQAYSDSLAGDGQAALSATQLAEQLVRLFHRSRRQAYQQAHVANYRLHWAIYQLLVKRYGEDEGFKIFKPARPDNIGMLIQAMLLNQMGQPAEAEQLLEEFHRMEGEYTEREARARGQPAAPSPPEVRDG